MNKTDEYNSNSVEALGDLQAIRKRPGMYISFTNNPGHMYTEVFDNSGDEAFAGYCKNIVVKVDTKEKTTEVRDYGRGIPIGKTKFQDITGEVHEMETLQLMFMKSHSGGKFEEGAYKISRGMHGVGLKIISALSELATATTYRDGKYVKITLSRGNLVGDLEYGDTDEPNGLYVKFKPDPEIFDTDIIPESHYMQITGISKAFGVPAELYIDGELQELPYNTKKDLMPSLEEGAKELSYFELEVVNENTGEKFGAAIGYTNTINSSSYRGYTNMIPNPGGGSHLRFFESCYKDCWKKYMDGTFRESDIFIGMRNMVYCFISNEALVFSSQTKERLTTKRTYFDQFHDELVAKLQEYFDNNNDLRESLIKKFRAYRASQDKLMASKELMSLVVVSDENTAETNRVRRRTVVPKLRECSSKNRTNTRIYITEGDSAVGSVLAARDVRYDAALPLRGKIKNVSYMDILDALKSEEVRSLVNSAGAGVGDDCNPDLSRYEEYIITADSDPDGKDIESLVISVYVNMMGALVKAGMLFLAVPPLYGWKLKTPEVVDGITYYWGFCNDIKDVPSDVKSYHRYKGLGEMNPQDFWEAIMSPRAKRIRIEYPDDLDAFNRAMTNSGDRFETLKSLGLIQWK